MRKIIYTCIASVGILITSPAFADDSCKLPGDVDEGKWYRLELVQVGSTPPVLIVDIDDCWIEVKLRKKGDSFFYSIHNIIQIIP